MVIVENLLMFIFYFLVRGASSVYPWWLEGSADTVQLVGSHHWCFPSVSRQFNAPGSKKVLLSTRYTSLLRAAKAQTLKEKKQKKARHSNTKAQLSTGKSCGLSEWTPFQHKVGRGPWPALPFLLGMGVPSTTVMPAIFHRDLSSSWLARKCDIYVKAEVTTPAWGLSSSFLTFTQSVTKTDLKVSFVFCVKQIFYLTHL